MTTKLQDFRDPVHKQRREMLLKREAKLKREEAKRKAVKKAGA